MYVIKIIHNYNIHTFNSYAMPEKENTKLSLYFKKETMNELTRLRDLLILTGLPSNELPDMNEFIDGIIAYSKNIIKEFPAERERLHEYSKGNLRKTTREDETETIETEEDEEITTESREDEEGSARFLYRITEEETENLNQIRNLTKIDLTNPTLIRTITEFCMSEKLDKKTILHLIFIATLYKITPKAIIDLTYTKDQKEDLDYTKKIKPHDKEQLRKITWDHGAFEIFKNAIETERHFIITLSKGKLTGGKLLWIFGIRPKTYNNILEKTKSKVNKFNYMTAYSGLAMINGMIEKNIQSIPEALIQINTTKNYTAKRITDYISYLITLSDMINNNPEI